MLKVCYTTRASQKEKGLHFPVYLKQSNEKLF